MKVPRHWPLWAESTDERWVPLTKGQQRRKCFHLMVSLCTKKENICRSLTVYYITAMMNMMSMRSVGYLGCQFQGLIVCIHNVKWSVLSLNIFCVTGLLCGEFAGHRWIRLTKAQWRGAMMFSLICTLDKRLSKQSWDWWFETPQRSLWRHCNVLTMSVARRLSHFKDCSI